MSTETVKRPTRQEVIAVLDEVVEEFGPDYRYPESHKDENLGGMCRYVYEGKPDCLAAQIVTRLGVPVANLPKYEGQSAWAVWLGEGLGNPDEPPGKVVLWAQVEQDGGATWGQARDVAVSVSGEES